MDLNADNKYFTTLLIEQVKLYALADMWGVEELSKLVVWRTYDMLRILTTDEIALDGTIEFVSFVYENIHPTMKSSPTDPMPTDAMRKLAAIYLYAVASSIGQSEAFLELMEGGGDLSKDMWHVSLGHQW